MACCQGPARHLLWEKLFFVNATPGTADRQKQQLQKGEMEASYGRTLASAMHTASAPSKVDYSVQRALCNNPQALYACAHHSTAVVQDEANHKSLVGNEYCKSFTYSVASSENLGVKLI
jgi:hypothetical protein